MSVLHTVGAAGAGALAVAVATSVGLRHFGGRHLRDNYRGLPLWATGGLALVPALLAGGVWSLATGGGKVAVALVLAGLGTAVLGLVDDLYGDRRAGGLLGHARALLGGRLTTGMVKAGGGAGIGLAAGWALGWRGGWVVLAGAVVALSSNLANLLDVRPGRMAKAWFPAAAGVLVLLAGSGVEPVVAAVGGGLTIFLAFELRERVMLGDTGAGLLGVVLGAGLVAAAGQRGLVAAAAVLGALTLLSEATSFTRLIERTPPLRWLDELGRPG